MQEAVMRFAEIHIDVDGVFFKVFANCNTNSHGQVECSNGEQTGGYNSITDYGRKSERNRNGVATTQTTMGGRAKTNKGRVSQSQRQKSLQDGKKALVAIENRFGKAIRIANQMKLPDEW